MTARTDWSKRRYSTLCRKDQKLEIQSKLVTAFATEANTVAVWAIVGDYKQNRQRYGVLKLSIWR